MSTHDRKPDRILVIACGALAHDLVRVKELNKWQHMEIQCLPAELHNHPEKIAPEVQRKIDENRSLFDHMFVAYSDCGSGGMLDKVLQKEGIERLPGAHCYEMFAGKNRFAQLHESELGTFYLTDFLATHFDRLIIKGMGLDRFPELKEMYFGNYKKLVYLAQLNDPTMDEAAQKAAKYLELEYQRVDTGDAFFEASLSNVFNVSIGSSR